MGETVRMKAAIRELRCWSFSLLVVSVFCCAAGPAWSADQAAIRQSVARGAGVLRSSINGTGAGHRSFLAYALLKAGLAGNSPEITGAVDAIKKKITDGTYHFGPEHLYEAGVDAMLLAEAPGEIEPGNDHPYLAEL